MSLYFLPVLYVVLAAWVLSESGLTMLKRSTTGAKRKDSGSLALLLSVIYIAVGFGVYLGNEGVGYVVLPLVLRWVGLLLIVAGLALRWWAIRTLKAFFTVDVAIRSDQSLIETGPYHLLRHPSYSGALLSFFGLTIALSSWISFFIILVPICLAFSYRIHIEEKAMSDAFPSLYPAYCKRTRRLIPGVY